MSRKVGTVSATKLVSSFIRAPMFSIDRLTPERISLIPTFRERWCQIAQSTQPVDQTEAIAAIHSAYRFLGKRPPKVLFFPSPAAALRHFGTPFERDLISAAWSDSFSPLPITESLKPQLGRDWLPLLEQLHTPLIEAAWFNWLDRLSQELFSQSATPQDFQSTSQFLEHRLCPELWAPHASVVDFCISVLGLDLDTPQWKITQTLMQSCGWFLPLRNKVILCDRPTHLKVDRQNRLHAEGEPAVQFSDGYQLYAYHGVILPQQYGELHPQQWRSQWVLSEPNAELRRVLIQGIDYTRLCQELQAVELDSWQEYTLLKIEAEIDIEPVHLLKMICPSTGHIYATRVPPHCIAARTAISWVNWGIDPEQFSIQT